MSKKKSVPVPVPASCWYFRDRRGHRFGPYRNAKEIIQVLDDHVVSHDFQPLQQRFTRKYRLFSHQWGWTDGPIYPDLIMEDAELNPVSPEAWRKQVAWCSKKVQAYLSWKKQYRHHTYRRGPVRGINHHQFYSVPRSLHFGRMIHDTAHGCLEDAEPPIRVKRRVHESPWSEDRPHRRTKNWKDYRQHQWHVVSSSASETV